MKKILFAAVAVGAFTASSLFSAPAADAKELIDITCHCIYDDDPCNTGSCKAGGSGTVCAGGDNIKCWEYDGNC